MGYGLLSALMFLVRRISMHTTVELDHTSSGRLYMISA